MTTKPDPKPCPFCGDGANSDVRDNQWTVACCACSAGQVTGFDTEQEAVAAWNWRCKPTSDDSRQTAAAQLKANLSEVLEAESAALEKLTLDELVEAVIQACECGDFMRHVCVHPEPDPSTGMRDVIAIGFDRKQIWLPDRQAITYIPFRTEQQLEQRIKALETAAEKLTEAMRESDRRYDFDCCGKLMLACRGLERVVEEEP